MTVAETRGWKWNSGTTPQDLSLEHIALGELAPGQVLVENHIIGMNPVDWKVMEFPEALGATSGKVPGLDAAGIVKAIGRDVDERWLGQRVAYHTSLGNELGSFAEHTPVDVRALIPVPEALGLEVAASVPCPALTAWLALDKLPQRPGAKVLVSGAGGAVGRYLVQLALQRDYQVTTLSHQRHWQRLAQHGATDTQAPWEPGKPWQGPSDFFAVVDSAAPEAAAALTDALAANGHVVSILGRLPEWPSAPFGRCLSMHEVALGALHVYGSDADWQRLTAAGSRILDDIAAGALEAEPLVMGDFEQLPEQLEALKNRSFSGKALVRVK